MNSLGGLLSLPATPPGLWCDAQGLRGPWRAGLYLVLVMGLVLVVAVAATHLPLPIAQSQVTPFFIGINELLLLLPVLAATALLAWLEGCRFAQASFLGAGAWRLWPGTAAGLSLLALTLLGIGLTGHAHLVSGGLTLPSALGHALAWGAVTLLIAATEELAFRGYLLRVLTRRSFWPGAVFTSLLFGALHLGNQGEAWLGASNVTLAGLLLALAVQRTGALWWSIGFHFGWDYAENFLFGTPDSGQLCAGALLRVQPVGTPWLSGAAAGPEGSVIAFFLLLLAIVAVYAVFDVDQRA